MVTKASGGSGLAQHANPGHEPQSANGHIPRHPKIVEQRRVSHSELAWLLFSCLVVFSIVFRFANLQDVRMSTDERRHYYSDVRELSPAGVSRDWLTAIRFHFDRPEHQIETGNSTPHPTFPILLMGIGQAFMGAGEEGNETDGSGARVVNGVLGISTALLVFFVVRQVHGLVPAVFAFGIAALLPLAVRFNRSLYLDSAFSLGWILVAVLSSRGSSSPTTRIAISAGVALAFVLSSKITGLLAVPFALVVLIIGRAPSVPFTRILRFSVIMLIVAIVLALAMNDPSGYIRAVLDPVDSDYRNRSFGNWLWYITQPVSLTYLSGVVMYLVTPLVALVASVGAAKVIFNWRRTATIDRAALVAIVALSPVIPLHLPGMSAEHGYMVFVPFLALLCAQGLSSSISQRWQLLAVVAAIVVMMPVTVIYGWRLSPLPYPSYLNQYDFGKAYYEFDREPLRAR